MVGWTERWVRVAAPQEPAGGKVMGKGMGNGMAEGKAEGKPSKGEAESTPSMGSMD